MLKLSSQKTVLVLMHIRSIHISMLRQSSGDGHVQKSTAFNLCLSTGGEQKFSVYVVTKKILSLYAWYGCVMFECK